jgi:hypothetical protein
VFIEGWNSWNHFQCNISEKLIRQTADAIVDTGLAKVGYQYGLFHSACFEYLISY